jgi:transposase-like protein
MHKTHLPLRQWFLAAHLVTTHSNGFSALQLQAKLGIGSYKTAWLLLHKLRRAMVNPDREKLGGYEEIVEIDETSIPFRTKNEPVGGGQGRSPIGKLNIIGAVEWRDEGRSGRIRLEPIRTNGRESLHPFVLRNTNPHTTIFTIGNQAYQGIPDRKHASKVVGKLPAHLWFKRIHRVLSLMKRWMMGVYHGVRRRHLNIYLQEFVFRWNRRRQYRAAFDSLVAIGNEVGHASLRDIVGRPPVLKALMERVRGGSELDRRQASIRLSPTVSPVSLRRDCSTPIMSRQNHASIGETNRRALSWPNHGRPSCTLRIDIKAEVQASLRRYMYPLCCHHRCGLQRPPRRAHMRPSAVRL